MNVIKSVCLILALVIMGSNCSRSEAKMADLVLLNGTIWTVDPARPWAEALAVDGDRISRVGKTSEIKKLVGRETQVVDLRRSLVLPGFIDSHTHFLKGGMALASIQLRDVTGREEFTARVAAKARELEKGDWILEGNWDHEQFSPPDLPRREWIDAVSPDNPVCVTRYDLHIALANSLALKLAGITKDTPSPAGGEIQKDPVTGEPTGIVRDAALALVTKHVPEPTLNAKTKAALAALRHAAEVGVTSVNDMAEAPIFDQSFEVYQELLKEGHLTTRIYFYIPIDKMEIFEELRLKTPFGNDRLTIGGLKAFADGGVGASTAYFFEPYADDARTCGLLAPQMFPEGIMEQRVRRAGEEGLQVSIHAIGDKANALILDIYERTAGTGSPKDKRFRIEHAQHLRETDIARFGRLGVIASVQPYHAVDDGRWMENRIGPERCRTTYAFKSLLDHGAVLALGSDWPVAPLDPLTGIHAAVTRQTTDGKNPQGWHPEQKISMEEAIKGFTWNGAYATFAEGSKGSLVEGKLADIVVLDQDLFKIDPAKIKEARVTMTIVGGRIVYERPRS
jgi:predicted amidohydrolase YtcJ